MNVTFAKRIFITASLLSALGYAGNAAAHSWSAVLDAAGNTPNATALTQVICYDDGNGPTHHIFVQIQDNSPAIPGLLLSAQVFKDSPNPIMANTTDTNPGDGNASQPIAVVGGDGAYFLSISKTNVAGARSFTVQYHCQTAADVHTGTSGPGEGSGILQLQ